MQCLSTRLLLTIKCWSSAFQRLTISVGVMFRVVLFAPARPAIGHRDAFKPQPAGVQPDAAIPKDTRSSSKSNGTMTLVARADSTISNSTASDSAGQEGVNGMGSAAPTSLCPVVGFYSFVGQLSFKAILHLAVFGGECVAAARHTSQCNTGAHAVV